MSLLSEPSLRTIATERTPQRGKTLFLVESASEVVRIRTELGGHKPADAKIVALNPEAEYALEKAGLPFALADEYYTEEEITRAGIANYERVDQFCDYVDAWFEKRSEIVKRFALKPARFNVYPLKILFDAISIRMFILKRILTEEKPSMVWAAPAEKADDPIDPFLLFRASIFARLLPLVCAGLGIPIRTWERDRSLSSGEYRTVVRDAVNPGKSRRGLASALRARWSLAQILGRGVGLSVWGRAMRRSGGDLPSVLVMDLNDREIQLITRSLIQRGACRPLYWLKGSRWAVSLNPIRVMRLDGKGRRAEPDGSLDREAPSLWAELADDPGFRRFLEWEGVDAFSAVESRLRHLFTDLLVKAAELNLLARTLFAQSRVQVVVTSQVALYWQRAICAAAHDAGVRVVNMQHGMMGERLCPIVFYTECEGPDYLLTYGTGMVDFCRRHYPQGAVPVPTGSPALDQLGHGPERQERGRMLRRLGLDPGKKTVVYCPTSICGNKFYVSHSYPKSDSRYFHIQRRIVECFKAYPALQFVVKQHVGTPSGFPLRDLIRDRRIENCRVVVEEPSFVELFPVADLFVLDSPTMTFLEVLTTRKPVLVFNNWYRWEPESLDLLKCSAVFSDDLDEFIGILRGYLATGRFEEARRAGSAYLWRFGTHLGDGRSADRAAEAIERIVQDGTPAETEKVGQA